MLDGEEEEKEKNKEKVTSYKIEPHTEGEENQKALSFQNCKSEALSMANLQQECFLDPRNPVEPYFRPGRQIL